MLDESLDMSRVRTSIFAPVFATSNSVNKYSSEEFKVAVLVHSWFSWTCAQSAIQKLIQGEDRVMYIFSRGFDMEMSLPQYGTIRFEDFERFALSRPQNESAAFSEQWKYQKCFASARELLLPNILYEPFYCLALLDNFRSVSFYQESIQPPLGTLCRRESDLLLDRSHSRSLFTCSNQILNRKITGKYYNLNEPMIPLHLHSCVVGEKDSALYRWIPPSLTDSIVYDYALFAGKAMNCEAGLTLIDTITSVLMTAFPKATILLKASPSSSSAVMQRMEELASSFSPITYMDGSISIERAICQGSIRFVISEMFSLAALAQERSDVTVISLDKTIINDFPSLRESLTERISNKDYWKLSSSLCSLSEHILSQSTE
jgi:hypothetical protein